MKQFLIVAFLLLYVLLRSSQCEVIEALCLEDGYLFPPNHLLYRPIGNILFKGAQALGYDGRSVYVLQLLNAFCGAIGVMLSYVAFLKFRVASWAALAASLLLGTSYIYWSHSTDATYIVMAGTFTAAALLCAALLIEKHSLPAVFCLSFFFALAILTWQAAIFMIPVFLWPFRRRIIEAMLFVSITLLIVGGVTVAIGVSQGAANAIDLLQWISNYAGGNLPMWGQFDISRTLVAAESAVKSIQQYPDEGPAEIFRYPLRIRIAYFCSALLAILTVIQAVQQALRKDTKLIWFASGYLSLWPFIIWWAPAEMRWFLVANIFLCGSAGLVWSAWSNNSFAKIVVFGAIAIMATTTFASSIWPKHADRGMIARKVECIARNVRSQDTVIAPDWNWNADLRYFYRIETLDIIHYGANFQNSRKLLDYIYNELQKTHHRGGRVFIVDPSSYSEQHLDWLAEQTTFTRKDFQRFSGAFAFQCEDAKFREVTLLER